MIDNQSFRRSNRVKLLDDRRNVFSPSGLNVLDDGHFIHPVCPLANGREWGPALLEQDKVCQLEEKLEVCDCHLIGSYEVSFVLLQQFLKHP